MNGKGDTRRPQAVSEALFDQNWARTFVCPGGDECNCYGESRDSVQALESLLSDTPNAELIDEG